MQQSITSRCKSQLQLGLKPAAPLPQRVLHPLVPAVCDGVAGVAPGATALCLLRPHIHFLGDLHHEHRGDAACLWTLLSLLFPALAAELKLAELLEVAAHPRLLHALARRRLLRCLVRLPAALGEDQPVAVLAVHHEYLHPPAAIRARAHRYAPGHQSLPLLPVALLIPTRACQHHGRLQRCGAVNGLGGGTLRAHLSAPSPLPLPLPFSHPLSPGSSRR
mmetsp:Transcript_5612/g.14231  ORF Transcript_5612/g.14231 Transcript_5612/m.14231 type:complete len:220 (-) Transcript_5612:590-1249(-)